MDADVEQLRARVQQLEKENARTKRTTTIALIVGVLGVLSPLLSMSGVLNAKFRKISAREVDVVDARGEKRIEALASDDGKLDTLILYGDDVTQTRLMVDGTGATINVNDHGGYGSLGASRDPILGTSVGLTSDSTTVVLNALKAPDAHAGLDMFTTNGFATFELADRGAQNHQAELRMGGGGDSPSLGVFSKTYDATTQVAGLDASSGGVSGQLAKISAQKDRAEIDLAGPNRELFSAQLADGVFPSLYIQQGEQWFWHAQNQAEKPAK